MRLFSWSVTTLWHDKRHIVFRRDLGGSGEVWRAARRRGWVVHIRDDLPDPLEESFQATRRDHQDHSAWGLADVLEAMLSSHWHVNVGVGADSQGTMVSRVVNLEFAFQDVVGFIFFQVNVQRYALAGGFVAAPGPPAPSCCIKPGMSEMPQRSVILPSRRRINVMPLKLTCLPVGAIPIKLPLCVPRPVRRIATRSPSARMWSSVNWIFGKAERNMATVFL